MTPTLPHDSCPSPNPWDVVRVCAYTRRANISGGIQGSEARGPGVSTSRGDGSLGQAQFGEAGREAEELLAQAEET